MTYTKAYTGVHDEIESIRVGVLDIDVTFKKRGYHKVNKIMNSKVYAELEYMKAGQRVSVVTDKGQIAWVKRD